MERRTLKKVTRLSIYDVASEAGCSHSAVAAVLAGKAKKIRISDATAARIQAVARRMGYRPIALARASLSGRSGVVAAIVSSVSREFVGRVMDGVLEALYERGQYTIKMLRSEIGAGLDSLLDECVEHRVEGVFCCDLTRSVDAGAVIQNDPARRRLRIVHTNCGPDFPGLRIDPDDQTGAIMAVDFLIALGHRQIGFIGGPTAEIYTVDNRRFGYRSAMLKAGLKIPEGFIQPAAWQAEAVAVAARKILTLNPRPTALLAVNDEAAATTIRVAAELGIKVPGDLSIVGFSDELLASFTLPTLTTIAQPHTDIGRRAIAALIEAAETTSHRTPTGVILLPVKLIVRESTAAPPTPRPTRQQTQM